jgi:fructokinase
MRVVCLGEVLIDFVALESGVSVGDASGFEKAPGGAPANVAVGCARLGAPVAFLGQVGDDPFGHFLVAVLEAEGVNCDGLIVSQEAQTPLAFVSLAADGERSFVFFGQISAALLHPLNDATRATIQAGQVFHFGGLTLIDAASRQATFDAARHARESGLIVHYDPTLRLSLWPDETTARNVLREGLRYADVVKVSDEERDFMADDVADLWCEGLGLIVVTHGAAGSTAYRRGAEPVFVPTPRVQAVDTTGAGDSFVAGLLTGILEHPDDYHEHLPELLRFANACGAVTATQRGAIPALPVHEQVTQMILT